MVLEPYRTFPNATYPFTVDVKARSCKKVMWRTTSRSTHLQFVRVEARLVCVVLSHIEARLVCATGLYALSPLDFSASIRDGLACDLGFYPRLYGMHTQVDINGNEATKCDCLPTTWILVLNMCRWHLQMSMPLHRGEFLQFQET